MRSYSYHEHTADIRLQVSADSLQELFIGALEGMNNLLRPNFCTQSCKKQSEGLQESFSLDAPDAALLLIDFLAEVLSLSHVHKVIFCHAHLKSISDTQCSGLLAGCTVDFFDEDIKAVTYHEAQVKKNDNGTFEASIVFDI